MMRPADFVGDATIPDWLEIGRQPHSAELLAPSLVVATLGMACVSTAKRSIRHPCAAPYDRHQRVWSSAMASMTSWATDRPSCRPAKRRMSAARKYRRIIVALIDVTYCGTARALASGSTTLPNAVNARHIATAALEIISARSLTARRR